MTAADDRPLTDAERRKLGMPIRTSRAIAAGVVLAHLLDNGSRDPARWAPHLPPKDCLVDEFGQVWQVTYMQEWSSGKRQFTVEPARESGSSGAAS